MTARRGRGRPVRFTDELQALYLKAITEGARLGEAAALVGINPDYPKRLVRTDAVFAQAVATAWEQGAEARLDRVPHREPRYNNYACRCRRCTTDASAGRAGRRRRAAERDEPGGDLIDLGARPESPTALSVPGLPSVTGHRAA